MTEVKILICGDVHGQFKFLFSKVGALIKKKGSFDKLLCVGDFFGDKADEWEDLKSGKIKVPLTTYILSPTDVAHVGMARCVDKIPNMNYMNRKGVYYHLDRVKIAYFCGLEGSPNQDQNNPENKVDKDSFECYHNETDLKEMVRAYETKGVIDILLSSQWPKGVTKYDRAPDVEDSTLDNCSSHLVAKVAKILKPRYHFSGRAGVFYERIPYRNHAVHEKPVNVTRFIALAPVNNPEKKKWLYAITIKPACDITANELTEYQGPSTVCPYHFDTTTESTSAQFFFDTGSSASRPGSSAAKAGSSAAATSKRSRGGDDHQSKKRQSIDSSSCWFCLSNSKVERQLIVSLGVHSYITLAKGALVPEHALIIPAKHCISSVELSKDAGEEIEKFKKALASYFHDKGQDVVFFERNYSSPHLQIQAVPVPKNQKPQILESLFSTAAKHSVEFNEIPNLSELKQVVPPKKPYFYLEVVNDEEIAAKHVHIISQKFPLQFGREILAIVLNVPNRIDWKRCIDPKTVEAQKTEEMRKAFQPYDFTV